MWSHTLSLLQSESFLSFGQYPCMQYLFCNVNWCLFESAFDKRCWGHIPSWFDILEQCLALVVCDGKDFRRSAFLTHSYLSSLLFFMIHVCLETKMRQHFIFPQASEKFLFIIITIPFIRCRTWVTCMVWRWLCFRSRYCKGKLCCVCYTRG